MVFAFWAGAGMEVPGTGRRYAGNRDDAVMTMTIREAGPDDIEAIISVGQRTWPATYGFAGPEYIATGLQTWWSTEAIRRSLENTTVLVAEQDGAVTGTGNIDLRGETPIIWKLYVVPEAQGTGVGSALISELLSYAGGRPVRLEFTAGNTPAAAFYAARGFVEIRREAGERPGWPETVWVERRFAE
ncbi:GNAT family N-acetyltransferase [Actinoplanes philippinensis]|uniref:GNAT family N-acetyltransferase n=1 Tax=Actinoplanes philippinensis TaxID=35752 RepID=UPI001160936D|nr:GNAT family N-acetyltransferase [Actinoplanes philippinensis]